MFVRFIRFLSIFVYLGNTVAYTLSDRIEPFGSALHVPLPSSSSDNDTVSFTVTYETTPDATAVQWLSPDQTAGKVHPYLFTQCQAIHARTMIPCQDTPAVKATYTASVSVPEPLVCVMSALATGSTTENPTKGIPDTERTGNHVFTFSQPVPIPSYLIAIAVGDLAFRDIGPRSRVYAEPSVVDSAAWEFAETEAFLSAGENLLGPYVWGRYDILMLPPSFCYGGMENPNITFVTPTLIAGDRSLADVVAHEIAHSWTGNLVTNATWEHFWLNEGFTMMVERKIIASLQGKGAAEFDAFSGAFALEESIRTFMSRDQKEFTKLIPSLDGIDPDDAFSSVPYEKGHYLLYYLQALVGEQPFEAFLHDYIQTFKYKSITSDDFRSYFTTYFLEGRYKLPRVSHYGVPPMHNGLGGPCDRSDIPLLALPHPGGTLAVPSVGSSVNGTDAEQAAAEGSQKYTDILNKVDWNAWFYEPGQTPEKNNYDASERGRVDAHASLWVENTLQAENEGLTTTKEWKTAHWIAFLEKLMAISNTLATEVPPAIINPSVLQTMDKLYHFSTTRNSELKLQWYSLSLRSGIETIVPSVCEFLQAQGRMKYVRPLFRELLRRSFGRDVALALFQKHKNQYHPICAKVSNKGSAGKSNGFRLFLFKVYSRILLSFCLLMIMLCSFLIDGRSRYRKRNSESYGGSFDVTDGGG